MILPFRVFVLVDCALLVLMWVCFMVCDVMDMAAAEYHFILS